MATNNCPKHVWDYDLVYKAKFVTMIAAREKEGVPRLDKMTDNRHD